MLKQATEIQTLQKQFQDINATLMSVVSKLTLTGNPMVSTAIQDITRLSQSIHNLELGVQNHLNLGRDQLTALMGIGSVINSSLGKEQVLEEVMDSLINLSRKRSLLVVPSSVRLWTLVSLC
jgi:hypothetical protein